MAVASVTKAGGDTVGAAERNALREDILRHAGDILNDTGAANAYIVTCDNQITALNAGQVAKFIADNANSGSSTLRFKNALSLDETDNLVRKDGTALRFGDIPASGIVTAIFDGTNWQIQSVDTVIEGFVATLAETVAKGDQVSLVDGQLEKLRRFAIGTTGTKLSYDSGNNPSNDSCKLDVTKVLSAWFSADDARYELAVLSVDPVTLGLTEGANDTSLTDNGSVNFIRVAPLGTDKAVVFYMNSSSNVMAVVATISGTTISLGTPQQVNTTGTIVASDVCQVDTVKCVFTYATTTTVYTRVATVSGTVFTFGTEESDAATFTGELRICKSASADVCVAAKNGSNMTVRHFSFSGTTLTDEGVANAGNNPSTLPFGLCSYDTDRVVVVYETSTASDSYVTLFNVAGAPSVITNRQWEVNASFATAIERIGVNRCLMCMSEGSSPFATFQVELVIDGSNPTVQYHQQIELDDGDAQANVTSLTTLLDETIDGEVRVVHVYNSRQGASNNLRATAVAEYNNYPEFKGIAAQAGSASDNILVIRLGKLTGLSGLTANNELFADPSGYTTSVRPFKIGHVPSGSTTVLEVNIERHSYSVVETVSLEFSVHPLGNGIMRVHHDLLVKPTSFEVWAASSSADCSTGIAGTDGLGGSIDELFAMSNNLIETLSTAPGVDLYDDRWVDFDMTVGGTSLSVKTKLNV